MYKCVHCQRNYQRKVYYDRHVVACNLLTNSKRENYLENQEHDDTPSVRQLYNIIMQLATKCNTLESKINDLQKWTNITKKKLNIIDWLNTTYTNPIDYDDWLSSLSINNTHLQSLFNTDYSTSVFEIIIEKLNYISKSSDINLPIRSFNTKTNYFYIYNKKNNTWSLCDKEHYNKLMHLLDKQLMNLFILWQNDNKHKISSDDFADLYSKNLKKIMGGNTSREQLYLRIKKLLYDYISSDPPNITTYDISY